MDVDQEKVKNKKFNWTLIIKILISAAILLFLIYKVDLVMVFSLVRRLRWTDILILFCFYLFTLVFASIRWKILLKVKNIAVSVVTTYKLYLIGFFFNNFLPTGIGGDVARGWHVARKSKMIKESIASIFIERMLGLLATLTIALVMLPFSKIPGNIKLLIVVMNCIVWLIVLGFYFRFSARFIIKVMDSMPFKKVSKKIAQFIESVHLFRENTKALLLTFFFSILYQFSLIFYFFLVGYFLGVNVDFKLYLVFVPIVWIVSLVPISLNAIGVREASFAFFFQQIGKPGGEGFIVSLLGFLVVVFTSLLGGIFFLLEKDGYKKAPA
ncbi:flippase-like domain-containing protein [bacterium]|nr:flippase-like domain-containing protein [bacterium]